MTGSTTLSLFSPNMKLARRARLVLGRVLMSGALLWCSVAQASPGNDAAREAMESAAEKELRDALPENKEKSRNFRPFYIIYLT